MRGILGSQPPDWLVSSVLERSDGNPFFAEELAAVSEQGSIPPGLHDLLLARLDRLDKGAQEVVRAAAIGGRRIGHRLLAAAVELPTDVLDAGLRSARQHHLLRVDEQGYAFRHALVHEAVLDELLPGERAGLHSAYARAIDFDHALVGGGWAAALVHHWTAAGRSDRAIAPALAAAVDAELAYALPEAQRYYDWLLSVLDNDDVATADLPVSRAEIVDRAADVASRAGDLDRAAQLIADALDGLDPQREPARAAILHERRGWCLLQHGRDDDALEAYEHAIRLVPANPPTAARARVLAAGADALERVDRPEHAAERAAEAVGVAVEVRSPGDEGHARHTLGVALASTGDLDGGLAELRRALDLAVRGGDLTDAAGIHRHLWQLVVAEGGAAELVAATITDAETARARAMPVLAGVLEAIAAAYCHQLGRWDQAEALLTTLDPGRVDGVVQLAVAALLDTARGDVERAGDRLEIVRANTLGLRDGRLDGLLFTGLAERAWSRGHLGVIPDVVDEGIQRTTDKELIGWMALTGLRAADAAGDAIDRWLALLGGLGEHADRRRLGPAAELRSAAATGVAEGTRLGGTSAPDAWASAAPPGTAPVSRSPRPIAGGVRPRPSCSPAESAMRPSICSPQHARRPSSSAPVRWPRRSSKPPAGPGSPVGGEHRRAPTGPADNDFGITAREFEVLDLLARGWTNRQIAESLFISEKTAACARVAPAHQAGGPHPWRRRRRHVPQRSALAVEHSLVDVTPPTSSQRPRSSSQDANERGRRSSGRCGRRTAGRTVAGMSTRSLTTTPSSSVPAWPACSRPKRSPPISPG